MSHCVVTTSSVWGFVFSRAKDVRENGKGREDVVIVVAEDSIQRPTAAGAHKTGSDVV